MATVWIPSSVQARKMRIAISPRFAAMTLLNGTGIGAPGTVEGPWREPLVAGFGVVGCWPPSPAGAAVLEHHRPREVEGGRRGRRGARAPERVRGPRGRPPRAGRARRRSAPA